jgi:hypothetical protein
MAGGEESLQSLSLIDFRHWQAFYRTSSSLRVRAADEESCRF